MNVFWVVIGLYVYEDWKRGKQSPALELLRFKVGNEKLAHTMGFALVEQLEKTYGVTPENYFDSSVDVLYDIEGDSTDREAAFNSWFEEAV